MPSVMACLPKLSPWFSQGTTYIMGKLQPCVLPCLLVNAPPIILQGACTSYIMPADVLDSMNPALRTSASTANFTFVGYEDVDGM